MKKALLLALPVLAAAVLIPTAFAWERPCEQSDS